MANMCMAAVCSPMNSASTFSRPERRAISMVTSTRVVARPRPRYSGWTRTLTRPMCRFQPPSCWCRVATPTILPPMRATRGRLRPKSIFLHQSRMILMSVTRCLMNMRSCSGMPRNSLWRSFSSVLARGRRTARLFSLSLTCFGNFWSSSSMLNDMVVLSLPHCARMAEFAQQKFSDDGGFTGNAGGLPAGMQPDFRGVKAPTRGERGNFFKVGFGIQDGAGVFAVGKGLHADLDLGEGFGALIPGGFARPSVGAGDAAMVQPGPGVMMHEAAGVKILDVAELLAQGREEEKGGIDVIAGVRQTEAGDDDPAMDARTDEKFVAAGEAFLPGTRGGAVEAKGQLDGFRGNGA